MPLSADRCQVTWGPNPLKKAEVGREGAVYVFIHNVQSMCMCVHERVIVRAV